jgi:hypothetical protein
MTAPRGVEARIQWFLKNDPSAPGMCAQHSWHSLGGDYGNPPRWGARSANEVYDKVIASKRYFTGTPKKGALVLWKYGVSGHAAICYNAAGTKIATTDPAGRPGKTGVESIDYPKTWGARDRYRIWTDQYNGVRFPVGVEETVDGFGIWDWFSGKPASEFTIAPNEGWKKLGFKEPASNIKARSSENRLLYLRVELSKGRTADRVIETRFVRANGDATAYHSQTFGTTKDSYPYVNTHFEEGDGAGGEWWVKVTGGRDPVKFTTRYAKQHTYYVKKQTV